MQLETYDDRKVSDANPLPVLGTARGSVIDLTLSLDTSAYADGDLLADTQELANAVRLAGGRAELRSLTLLDESDQKQPLDIVLLDANQSLGSENAVPGISDANAAKILGAVSVAAGDYKDIGGCSVACLRGIGLALKAASDSTSLYLAAVSRGSGTYGATAIRLKLGLVWD